MEKDFKKDFEGSLKLLVKSSLIVFVGLFLSKILGYAYRLVIARYFGPEAYGIFSISLMVASWFVTISALGLVEGLVRFIPLYRGKNEDEKARSLFRFSLKIILVTGTISFLIMFFFSEFIAMTFFHNENLITSLRIFSLAIPTLLFAGLFLVVIRAHEEIGWYSFIYNVAQNVIKLAAIGLLILLGIGDSAISWSYLAGLFAILVLSYVICKYKISHIFLKYNLVHNEESKIRKELLAYSVPLFLFGIVSYIFYWIDTLSIGYFKSTYEVGLYNAAIPIAMLLGIASELFMQLFFPLITKEYARNRIKMIEQLSKQVAKWIFLVNLPLFAVMIVFPGAIINILFGSQYLAAENALRVLCAGSLISSIFIVSNQLVSMMGKSKLVLMNITIASIANFILNALFVPMQNIGFVENANGLIGAAIATFISLIILNMLFMIETKIYLDVIPLRRKMITLSAIAIVSTSVLFYLRTIFSSSDIITLGMLFTTFIALYVFLVLIFGGLDSNDWGIMKDMWRKIRSVRYSIKKK